jgi:hypothetical protein
MSLIEDDSISLVIKTSTKQFYVASLSVLMTLLPTV